MSTHTKKNTQRADFVNLLYDLAAPYMTLRLCSRVVDIAPSGSSPSLTLSSGQIIHCDLIVGADGLKSFTRQIVVGQPDNAIRTGDAAYRALIPIEAMKNDEDLMPLITSSELNCWMGPGKHIVAYCVVSFFLIDGQWEILHSCFFLL